MANRMKSMRDKLMEILDEHQKYNFTSESSSREKNVNDERETVSKVQEGHIHGRAEEKERVLSYLYESINDQDITILPIYGIGGIGKTTLAQLVYDDKKFVIDGYIQAWVYVSRIFDLKKIGNSIITQVLKGDTESNLTGRERINKRLEEIIAGKKIMIVLDDVWENDPIKLGELKNMLKVNGSKVLVIVTTREECIAREICAVQTPYKLEHLTDEMCWEIIKQKSAFEERDDKERLVEIGKEIAGKCGGVALAAQSLGYLLRKSKNCKDWESVRDSHIWNVSPGQDSSSPLASLLLSYEAMAPFLKLCFGYCAIFPKGHKINKDDLIRQWISLGFIKPPNNQSPSQLSEDYIAQLLGTSFLQFSELPSVAVVHDQYNISFTMHDLVHDVARSVMVDEVFYGSKDNNTDDRNYRYAPLTVCSKPSKLPESLFAKLRAIRFMDNTKLELRDIGFSSSKFLRVLDLSGCSIQRLPDCIGQFKLLRYLNAPGVQYKNIPKSITKLSNLNYLILRGSSAIKALPESFGEMKSLMYLDLSGCSGIKKLPGSFGKLENLVHLDLSNCFGLTCVSESFERLINLEYLDLSCCINIGDLNETLVNLLKLEYLNLSSCSYIELMCREEVRGTLGYFDLSSNFCVIRRLPEALTRFNNLKYLNLSGWSKLEELPTSFGNMKSLIHLDLSKCSNIKGIPEALGSLTNLQFLNLSKCHNIFENELAIEEKAEAISNLNKLQYLNLSKLVQYHIKSTHVSFFGCIKTLSNLEHLDLSGNDYLESLPDCFGILRKLHTLDLSGCRILKTVPASIGQIDSLKYLDTNGCSYLEWSTLRQLNNSLVSLPHFMVQTNDDGSSSNIGLLQDENPPDLEICSLENVRSVKEVQIIRLVEKQRIEVLKLEWTKDSERSVDDVKLLGELVPPRTLKIFKITGYNGAKFPDWIMGMAYYLPNLLCITLMNIPNCINLPPLGQLPNLEWLILRNMESIVKIDGELCGGPSPFPRLKIFVLGYMKNLEVWNTTYPCDSEDGMSEYMFPRLCELKIISCPNLRFTSCLPRTEKWTIRGSDGVISSWAEGVLRNTGASSSLPTVTSLEVIIGCNVSSLNSLGLRSYGLQAVELPEWLGQLTSLKRLKIRCLEVEASLESIKHLTSLKKLSLSNCEALTALPHSVGDLSSLKELAVEHCPNLIGFPEGMGRLTSLKKLEICYCKSIKSLPNGIEKLTMLEEIHIEGCPELKQWCELEDIKKRLARVSTLQTTRTHNYDDVTVLTMHDLVHDLARSILADEFRHSGIQDNAQRSSCRYALLSDCSKPLESYTDFPGKIRALRFLNCGTVQLHEDAFSSAKHLRVLDLSECCIQKLPESIGHLKQLRYLNAPGVQHQRIPDCITKLYKLMYLSLRGSSTIKALQESIGEMKCLIYLDLSDCSSIEKLPGSFAELKKLVHLDLSNCRNIGELLGDLGNLSELEYLNLSGCSCIKKLPEDLSRSNNLTYLNISGLEKLEELPTSFGSIKSLVHLDLSGCHQVRGITEALGGLTKLLFLNLSHSYNIFEDDLHIRTKVEAIRNLHKFKDLNLSGLLDKNVRNKPTYISFFECISTFSNLEHLDLSKNRNLRSLPDCYANLKKLHTLDLSGCSYLEMIPESLRQIESLKFIHTNGCYRLENSKVCFLNKSSILLPNFVVQPNDDGSSSNIVLLRDVNHPNLIISCLDQVRSIEEVQSIRLKEKQKLERLILAWSRHPISLDDRILLGELLPPISLKDIEIDGYNGAKIPFWLMDIVSYLPNLVCVTLKSLSYCTNLPPLGRLTLVKLNKITKIDADLCGGPRAFPRLKEFYLQDMGCLELWNTTYSYDGDGSSEFMFPKLQILEIYGCEVLTLRPCPPRVDKWDIKCSDMVLSSWGESASDTIASSSSPMVTTLNVWPRVSPFRRRLPLNEWRLLHHLPHLKGLKITDCIDLTMSPKIIGALSSLQSLALLNDDKNVELLPDWLPQLTSLRELVIRGYVTKESQEYINYPTSLETLALSCCQNMTAMLRSVGELTALQRLTILECPNLNDLPESIRLLTSLKKLKISSCNGIKFLPDGIQELTKLEHLEISGCPELTKCYELEVNKTKLAHVKHMLMRLPASFLPPRSHLQSPFNSISEFRTKPS
uniref:Uncharacterized protein n=1 Tax=Oryza brachyantha TaxID=4533 RepID=J3N6T1_ORYBR